MAIDGITEVTFPKALVNAYIVQADVPTIIDTGTPGGAKKLLSKLTDGTAPQDVGRIILTHRHADHAGSAAELARLTGAEVLVSPGDGPYVTTRRKQPVPSAVNGMGRVMVPYIKLALPWELEPVAASESLVDGAQVGPFRVVATPGHTGGHVSLLWEERGVLFTGDAAANVGGLGPHSVADDPAAAKATFAKLADLPFDAACFGHGKSIPSGAAAKFRAAGG